MPTSVVTTPTTFVVGNVHRFINAPTKDGSAQTWTSVYLVLINPSGTVVQKLCTNSGSDWYYDTLATDLNVAGMWRRRWRVLAAGIDDQDQDVNFYVDGRQGA